MATATGKDADSQISPADDPGIDTDMVHTVHSLSGDEFATPAATEVATKAAAAAGSAPPTDVVQDCEPQPSAQGSQQPGLLSGLDIGEVVRQHTAAQPVVAGPLPQKIAHMHEALAVTSIHELRSRCCALRGLLDQLCVRKKPHTATHAPRIMTEEEETECKELELRRRTHGMLPVRSLPSSHSHHAVAVVHVRCA